MTPWSDYAVTVIVQVSAICLVTLALTACVLHSPASRNTLGVLGLILVLGSPLVALMSPRRDWWRSSFSGSQTESPMASQERATPRSLSIELQPPVFEDQTIHVEETETLTDPMAPSFESAVSAAPASPSDAHRPRTMEAEKATSYGGAQPSWPVALAGFVWYAGSVISAGLWIWQTRRLRWLTRSLDLAPGRSPHGGEIGLDGATPDFPAIAREACQAVGLRKLPPIAVSQTMPMPLVLGVWRPTIILPRELLHAGAEARLRDVLIHEAAHVVRRDAWVHVAQRLAAVLWWWHPGVLGLNRAITRSREEVCDNFVLRRSDASHYAQTLLELAEKCAQAGRSAPQLGLLESWWTLEARIRGLLKPGRETMTRTKRRTVATIATLLGAVCFSIGGVRAVEDEDGSTSQPKQAQPPQAAKAPVENEPAAKLRKVTVRGQCVDDQSQPLADVRVLIVRRSEDYMSQFIEGETKSAAQGRFELRGVKTAMLDRGDLFAVAAREGHVSACVRLAKPDADEIVQEIKLLANPGTLSGVVTDPQGRPIPGVTVYVSCCVVDEPLPGILSSVTDEHGRYAITDLKRWTPKDTATFDPKTGTGTIVTSSSFHLKHPDYPKTTAHHSAVPQEVNVTLYPPAIIEGQVIDAVANQPAAGVKVSAQGVARSGWARTHTDVQGRYRLRMTQDHYNIWADAEDRIAVAVKAIEAKRGETVSNADIRLLRGGFVVGTVFDAEGKPISPTKEAPHYVAHYGPARPRTGAAVTSTPVQPDGTYRLRVAPGRNFVYSMSGPQISGYVTVEEGQEVSFDIHLGEKQRYQPEDEDQRLARKLLEAARREDAESGGADRKRNGAPNASTPAPRQRPDTPIGKLLDELAEQNAGPDRFHDVWANTLKQIVELGPEAVPELIAELDATNSTMMLSCLGFTLRAIDDKRAVPALIRSIPKTLVPPGSDSGLRAEDEALTAFMKKHDLDERNEITGYGFGRPVCEIFGALNQLTGQAFGEEQLYSIFAGGTANQQQLKQKLYAGVARKWADWWEQHWKDHVDDPAYAAVNLPEPQPVAIAPAPSGQPRHYKTSGGSSNWILGSYADPNTLQAFYDLDTGRTAGLPEKWRQAGNIQSHLEEIEAWAAQEGFDLMGTEYVAPDDERRYYALRPIGLQAWELGEHRWKMTSSDITFEALQAEGTPAAGWLLHFDREKAAFDPQKTATFLFQTREGTPGLLFVGIEVQDDSLKPGGVSQGDNELQPIAFFKGRRFGWTGLEELPANANP